MRSINIYGYCLQLHFFLIPLKIHFSKKEFRNLSTITLATIKYAVKKSKKKSIKNVEIILIVNFLRANYFEFTSVKNSY